MKKTITGLLVLLFSFFPLPFPPVPLGSHLYTQRADSCQHCDCLRAFFMVRRPLLAHAQSQLEGLLNNRLESMHKFSSFLAIQVGQL